MEIKNTGLVKKLTKSNLTDKEAQVYVSVLELGGALPSRVAKYAGLRRSTTYNILTTLSVRGFINEIKKGNKIFYQVDKPENILKYTELKLNQAKESVNEITEILPDIKNIYHSAQNQPKITYYSGEKGVFDLFDDMVVNQKPYEMLSFTNGKEITSVLHPNHDDTFVSHMRKKEKCGITTRIIMPDTKEDKQAIEDIYKNTNKNLWPVIRFVKEEKFPSASEITVYSTNKVAIVNFKKNQETGVIIEDQAIHDMMKTIFELSWDSRQLKD